MDFVHRPLFGQIERGRMIMSAHIQRNFRRVINVAGGPVGQILRKLYPGELSEVTDLEKTYAKTCTSESNSVFSTN
jgi:hypothetical protein